MSDWDYINSEIDEPTFESRNNEILNNPPSFLRIPGDRFPHASFKDALWISMQARELRGIATGGRGGNLTLGRTKTQFRFLAPPEILEMHNHEWEEYASLASRLLEKVSQLRTMTEHGQNLLSKLGKDISGVIQNGADLPSLKSIEDYAGSVNLPVPSRKMDTPLSYKTSQRRQYQFEFVLADSQGGKTVVQAVKLMESFAAPRSTSVLGIEFPHIFKVQTEPEGLILMEHAAITSIQPTWQYPYIKGYPTRCNLTLNFTDMSPLFENTIKAGTIIRVNPSSSDTEPTYHEPSPQGSYK
jgi:hypothetical protein